MFFYFSATAYNAEKETKSEWEDKQKKMTELEELKKAQAAAKCNLILFGSYINYTRFPRKHKILI